MRKTQVVLQTEVKSFIEEAGRECCLFVTFTFADKIDFMEASRRWHSFNTGFLSKLFNGLYIKVTEFTESGRVHYHVLFRQPGVDFSKGFDWTAYRLAKKFRAHGKLNEARKWTKQYSASAVPELRELWDTMTRAGRKYKFGRIECLPIRETGEIAGYYLGKYVAKKCIPEGHERMRHVSYGRGRQRVMNMNFSFLTSAFRQKMVALAAKYPALIVEKALHEGKNAWFFMQQTGWDVQAKFHNLVHVKQPIRSDGEGGFFLESQSLGEVRYRPNERNEWILDASFCTGVPF